MGRVKLNWGSGPVRRGDWVNLDANPAWEPTLVSDTRTDPIPLPTGSVRMIVANHSLQMVGWHELAAVLAEWRRVLTPGGVVRILVPDVTAAFRAALLGNGAWFPIADDVCPTPEAKLAAYLTWFSEARCCHTEDSLRLHLEAAGFDKVNRCPVWETILGPDEITQLDSRGHESIVVEAVSA